MEDKCLVILNLVLLVALLYGYYSISITGKMTNFTKWLITGSATAILILSDKVVGVVTILVVLVLKAIIKPNNNGVERP